MKINLKEISIRDIVEKYENNNVENGVIGYNGKLNIRPKYQREFVYSGKPQEEVIRSVMKNFPLNVLYWAKNPDDFEVIDGQQRTISICEYIKGNFSVDDMFFHNLTDDSKNKILDYKLMVYICEGVNSEKLDWFKTINIAGVKLTEQELRNAVYSGEWLSDAKKFFSKQDGPAYNIAKQYLKGVAIRQDYLETVLKWISNDNINQYMAKNQNNPNSNELTLYFKSVISWIEVTFVNYRKEMKGIDYGSLYNEFKDVPIDSKKIEQEISILMQDSDIINKSGIYHYVLNRNEKHLNLRTFDDNLKRETYEKQQGICGMCKDHFEIEEMESDHIIPWSKGGKTNVDNHQLICRNCNRTKSNK